VHKLVITAQQDELHTEAVLVGFPDHSSHLCCRLKLGGSRRMSWHWNCEHTCFYSCTGAHTQEHASSSFSFRSSSFEAIFECKERLSNWIAESHLTIVHHVNVLHTPCKQCACNLTPQCSTSCTKIRICMS
jgi:hypothetical protein